MELHLQTSATTFKEQAFSLSESLSQNKRLYSSIDALSSGGVEQTDESCILVVGFLIKLINDLPPSIDHRSN